jgi:hypothetical protein
MPRRNSLISRLRYGRAWDEWDEKGGDEGTGSPVPSADGAKPRSRRRRAAVAVTFAALFVAGAAFSAAAGDQVRASLEDSAASLQASTDATTSDATPTDATTTDATTTDATVTNPTDSAPATDSGSDGGSLGPAGTPGDAGDSAPARDTTAPPEAAAPVGVPSTALAAKAAVQQAATRSGSVSRVSKPAGSTRVSQRKFVRTMGVRGRRHHFPVRKQAAPAPAPELEGASSAVVWLNRPLPDPTPPALRLKVRFAKHLRGVARANHVDWALMLGVLRAEGHNGAAPANLAGLRAVAAQLSSQAGMRKTSPWAEMFTFSRDTSFADRAVALSHYYRAVGLRALVHGLDAEKTWLGERVLNDPRVSIYAGGRGDIESGRVNVRVLTVIEYLADSFGQVTVSCLISGHRLYARPGVISAHIYGLAADISEVGGTPIFGHQQPGGITERAVRDVLLLPPELMPKQVISLLGLGGPSFPLANHYDHIHIGY